MEAGTRLQPVKTKQAEKIIVRAVVNYRVSELAIALSLFVVTSFKSPLLPTQTSYGLTKIVTVSS